MREPEQTHAGAGSGTADPRRVDAGDRPRRFGARVAGVGLLLPEGVPLEYVSSAPLYRMPGVGPRVVGLTQLRGHPVVVLDPAPAPAPPRRAGERRAVLLLGAIGDGAALCVDEPPEPVSPGAAVVDAARPDCAFAEVLEAACARADDDGSVWWSFDPARLFAVLAVR